MQNLIKHLSDALNKELSIDIISKEITIQELQNKEKNSSCKKVTLKTTSKSLIAFSLDTKISGQSRIFPFFNNSLGSINKANDGIIFYKKDNNIFVLLIELKSNNLGSYKHQLQAGKNFILYLNNMLNLTFSKKYNIKDENIKCLVFSTRKTERKFQKTRKNIIFEDIDGLNIVELQCNEIHYIEKFL